MKHKRKILQHKVLQIITYVIRNFGANLKRNVAKSATAAAKFIVVKVSMFDINITRKRSWEVSYKTDISDFPSQNLFTNCIFVYQYLFPLVLNV